MSMATKSNALSLRFTAEELQDQVSNYSSLKLTKSARGLVVLFFGALNLFTLIVVFLFNIANLSFWGVLLEIAILYVPLLFFAYRGHRWALIALMVVWAGDKIYTSYYQMTTGGTPLASIIFLLVGVAICMKALQVENARRLLKA
jgi:hypothetical protein